MRNRRLISRIAASLAVALAAGVAEAAAELPLAGCYERAYDATHLRAHQGQLVARATLLIAADNAPTQNTPGTVVATAVLKLWLSGTPRSFDTIGACRAHERGLLCDGSLSAAEADTCKSKRDGVRQCRIDPGNAGSFKVENRPDGVLVSIHQRLELVPAPYDAGPFLSLSQGNPENHAFLLKRLPDACK